VPLRLFIVLRHFCVPVILMAADNRLILLFFVRLRFLFESLTSDRLRRLVLFENFNQTYPASYMNMDCDPMRIPSSYVSPAVANVSLTLEHSSEPFACVKSHDDAIRHLKLSKLVIRSVSLRQIQTECIIREGVQSQ
jgi:hypothetical protein